MALALAGAAGMARAAAVQHNSASALSSAAAGAAKQTRSTQGRKPRLRVHAKKNFAWRLRNAWALALPALPARHADGAGPDGGVGRHGCRHHELLHDAPRVDQPPLLHRGHLIWAIDELLSCGKGSKRRR